MKNHIRIYTACLMLCLTDASNLIAQDLTTFTATESAMTSYTAPYSILGVHPGMKPDEALELLQDHFDQELTFDEGILNTSNTAGTRIQYVLRPTLGTFWVTPNIRLSGEPYEQLYASLGTGVIGERVLSISKSINDDRDALPSPQALKGQLEAEYGPPSFLDIGPVSLEMFYTWDGDGFIPDLRAQSRALYESEGTKGPDAKHSSLSNLHHRTT